MPPRVTIIQTRPHSRATPLLPSICGLASCCGQKQFTAGDAWNVGCEMDEDINCPEARGPDLDFASSPILRILPNGRRVILAGQKSGVMHAIDPDRNGEILWQHRVGKGGLAGGIQWGSAADAKQVYVAAVRYWDGPDFGL